MQGGYVYAIGIEGTTLVKIGRTQNVEQRLRALQTGLPYRLKVLKVYSCGDPQVIEQRMHGLLKEQCHAREWFDLDVQGLDTVFQEASTFTAPAQPVTGGQLGERIVAARRAHKPSRMSQRELAKLIGVSTKSLNQIETGETSDPRSSIVRKVSEVLGVSADWLLKGDGSETDSGGERQALREGEALDSLAGRTASQQPPEAAHPAPVRSTRRPRTRAKVAEP